MLSNEDIIVKHFWQTLLSTFLADIIVKHFWWQCHPTVFITIRIVILVARDNIFFRVKPKTIKLVFATSRLKMQHLTRITKTGRL